MDFMKNNFQKKLPNKTQWVLINYLFKVKNKDIREKMKIIFGTTMDENGFVIHIYCHMIKSR